MAVLVAWRKRINARAEIAAGALAILAIVTLVGLPPGPDDRYIQALHDGGLVALDGGPGTDGELLRLGQDICTRRDRPASTVQDELVERTLSLEAAHDIYFAATAILCPPG